MGIPEAKLTIKDGGLGIAAQDNSRVAAKVGPCSAGTANVVGIFNTPQAIRDALGAGPLVESACYQLAVAGGPIVLVKTPSSTPGAAGSATATKTGTATLAVTGAALDAADLKVLIIQGGASLAAATATFKYSLDGGRTYSAEISIPTGGIYVIPNTGLTLTWTYTTGTGFVAGDFWVATVTGPSSTLAEIQAAIDALLADPTMVFNVHVLGVPADISAAAALSAALETKMQNAANTLYRYLYATHEMPSDTDANIKTGYAAVAGTRIEAVVSTANITSAITGSAVRRPAAWVSAARAASVVPSEDLGRFATGAVRGVVAITRDEFATQGLDQARFTTLRSFVGEPGYYITSGRLLASGGSDFALVQRRRVMDVACAALRRAQLRFLNESILVDATTGLIVEAEANDIDNYLESALRAALTQKGWASDCTAKVDRLANIITTEILPVNYSVTPLAYAKSIEGTIGFKNPAIAKV